MRVNRVIAIAVNAEKLLLQKYVNEKRGPKRCKLQQPHNKYTINNKSENNSNINRFYGTPILPLHQHHPWVISAKKEEPLYEVMNMNDDEFDRRFLLATERTSIDRSKYYNKDQPTSTNSKRRHIVHIKLRDLPKMMEDEKKISVFPLPEDVSAIFNQTTKHLNHHENASNDSKMEVVEPKERIDVYYNQMLEFLEKVDAEIDDGYLSDFDSTAEI